MTPHSRPSPGPCGQPISDYRCQPAGVHHHYKPTGEPHSESPCPILFHPTCQQIQTNFTFTLQRRCQALPVICHTTKPSHLFQLSDIPSTSGIITSTTHTVYNQQSCLPPPPSMTTRTTTTLPHLNSLSLPPTNMTPTLSLP